MIHHTGQLRRQRQPGGILEANYRQTTSRRFLHGDNEFCGIHQHWLRRSVRARDPRHPETPASSVADGNARRTTRRRWHRQNGRNCYRWAAMSNCHPLCRGNPYTCPTVAPWPAANQHPHQRFRSAAIQQLLERPKQHRVVIAIPGKLPLHDIAASIYQRQRGPRRACFQNQCQ